MAKPVRSSEPLAEAPIAPAEGATADEPTVTFTGVLREGQGWSLYRLQIPRSWLVEGERLREGDSLMGVLQGQRHLCLLEAQL
jgi:hypothetical protein